MAATAPLKLYTLVFVRHNAQVLLGMKKRGFGEGRWNGFGGKVEPAETVRAAAARELREESGLSVAPHALKPCGHLEFYFLDVPPMEVKVFSAKKADCAGEVAESEEMRPRWFHEAALPQDSMWPDDKFWYPYLLRDELFHGVFHFHGFDLIVDHTIRTAKPEEIEPA